MSGALIERELRWLPYRNRGIAAGTLRSFVIGRNILRFAAFDTGYYCEKNCLAPHLAGVETDAHSPQSDRPTVEQGAGIRVCVGRAGGAD